MSEEEKIIQELTEVRPEMLNEKALKLFNFMMKKLDELEEKDKQIDLMTEWTENRCFYADSEDNYCEIENDRCNKDTSCKKCIKQYFETKAKEVKNEM